MYNMSMLRHRFSNERWGARPEPPSSFMAVKVCTSIAEIIQETLVLLSY